MIAQAGRVRSEDFTRYVPYQVTRSSESLGWRGFRVEVVRGHAAGEITLPPLDQHLLNVILAVPNRHYHAWDGAGREETGQEGAASLVPAGRDSRWRWNYLSGGVPCDFHMHIKTEFVRSVAAQDLSSLPNSELRGALCFYQPQLRSLSAALMDEVESNGSNGALYAESLATAVVALLLGRQSPVREADQGPRGRPAEQVRVVCRYVDEHLGEELHLEALGRLVGLGPERLRIAFRQALGETPYHYVLRRRIETARSLLRSTSLPVTEIALRLGFADHSHFTSTFRRETGLTPTRYRQECLR